MNSERVLYVKSYAAKVDMDISDEAAKMIADFGSGFTPFEKFVAELITMIGLNGGELTDGTVLYTLNSLPK